MRGKEERGEEESATLDQVRSGVDPKQWVGKETPIDLTGSREEGVGQTRFQEVKKWSGCDGQDDGESAERSLISVFCK